MSLAALQKKGGSYSLFTIVVLATAAGSLTQTVMNSMLVGVGADFGVDASIGQWLTTIYMLILGITVPIVTWLSQKLSVKNIVYLSLGFFFVGSLVAWLAPSFAVLLAGRVLQAIAAGITIPLLQAIAMTRFPRERVGTMMGIAGIAMGFAPNIGPLIGGVLVDSWGWRSFFALFIGLVVLLALATFLFVESEDNPARDASLDTPSFALSTLGFGGLLLGLSNAASLGEVNAFVWLPLLVGIVGLALFVKRQNSIEKPLINMRIFESATYRVSFIAQNLLNACFMGITLIVPLYVQGLCGGTAVEAGLVFIPATVLALVLNPVAGIAADRFGIRPVVLTGSVLLTAGSVSMAFMDASTPLWLVTLLQTIRGAGVSSLVGPLITLGMRDLPREVAMDGSAFFSTVRQACASLGTAGMVLIITAVNAAGGVSALAYQLAFGLSAIFAVATLILAIWKVK